MNNNIAIYNSKGEEVGQMPVEENLLPAEINPVLLHEVVVGYLANQRRGTACTKTRAEVQGSGKKPWRQKGTGRARAGSIRSPLWRHGGIIFGPKPRDYSQNIPHKKREVSLMMSLKDRLDSGQLVILEKLEMTEPKTRLLKNILDKLKIGSGTILVTAKTEENLKRAGRNLDNLDIITADSLNTYQVLNSRKIIFLKEGWEFLVKRLKNEKRLSNN